jgi:ABC-type tungstate transport system permease subunit
MRQTKKFMRVFKCNSKTKALFFAAFLVARSSIAAAYPVISSSSEDSVRMSSTSVAKANGSGSYVTGMIEPLFGYAAPSAAQVSVAAYGASGKLLGEKVGEIDSDDLVITHLNPSPHAAYVVFLPWEPSQIAKVTVTEYSGHTHDG